MRHLRTYEPGSYRRLDDDSEPREELEMIGRSEHQAIRNAVVAAIEAALPVEKTTAHEENKQLWSLVGGRTLSMSNVPRSNRPVPFWMGGSLDLGDEIKAYYHIQVAKLNDDWWWIRLRCISSSRPREESNLSLTFLCDDMSGLRAVISGPVAGSFARAGAVISAIEAKEAALAALTDPGQ